MSYLEFNLEQVVTEFALKYDEKEKIFEGVESVEPSPWLKETLDFNLPLAIAIGSEKARSEMLIAPIIWEMKRRHGSGISIFSGREFNNVIQGLKLGRTMGLEPTNGGTTIHCLNLLATLAIAFFTIASRLFLDLLHYL